MWLQGGCVQFDTRQGISVLCGYREDVYSLTLDRGFVCCVVTGRMCSLTRQGIVCCVVSGMMFTV